MSVVKLVPIELLEALAATAEPEQQKLPPRHQGSRFDLERWIADRNLDVRGPEPWQGGRRWIFNTCPWNEDHRNRSAFIVQQSNGVIGAGCHHDGCSGKGWHELRDIFEPGWREQDQSERNGHARRPITPEELVQYGIASDHLGEARADGRQAQAWGEIEPFDSFNLPAFPVDCLPRPLREWAQAESEATQTPTDLPAMLSLAVVSVCCAKRVEIDVRPGWREPTNIYVVVVLPPAERKSAIFAHATEPLREYERELAERMGASVREYAIQLRTLEGRLKQLELKAAKTEDAEERKRIVEDAKVVAEELALLVPVVPPRLIVDDCTPERLTSLLAEQGGRITVAAPEGAVFDLMKGAYSKAGVPVFGVYLQGHSGDDIRVDRVSRPGEYVHRPAITMALAVQPEVIHGMFGVNAFRGRGLLGRILYAIPTSTLGTRIVHPAPVPEHVARNYRDVVKGLCCLSPGVDDHGRQMPHPLTLSSAAKDVLYAAMGVVEPKLGPGGEFEHYRDWAGKLIGAEVRIAALLHMVANVQHWQPWSVPISAETMQAAISIGNYLVDHASAAYTLMGTDADVSDAEHIWRWAVRHKVAEFTKRDLHQAVRRRFPKADALDAPLAELVRRNYIRRKQVSSGVRPGRPASPAFEANPEAITAEGTSHRREF